MILQETYTLPNGVEIPKLGLGTWMIENDQVAEAVRAAAEIGYRHIDTAQAYQNEAGVGAGVRSTGLARDEMFVTTKLAAEHKSYEDAKAAIDGSLKALDLDHIDMMLIHSPWPWADYGAKDRYFEGNIEAWRAMEEAYAAGKLRAIGVSNFQKPDLDNLFETASVKPMLNQILAHVSNTPFELIDDAQSRGMVVGAFSPVGHGEILKNAEIAAIAETYGVTIPQLAIRYILQLGLLPLPKTANPEHMRTNADVDFEISEADMAALKAAKPIENYGASSHFPVFSGKA